MSLSWTADGYWLTRTGFPARARAHLPDRVRQRRRTNSSRCSASADCCPYRRGCGKCRFANRPACSISRRRTGRSRRRRGWAWSLSVLVVAGCRRPLFVVAVGGGLGRDVGALPFVRQCRPDVLWLRMGIDSAGGGVLRDLPRQRARPRRTWITIVLLRWLCFRVMFGAGLIKLRGDPCWRDMTCLDYHYETQPMPNPLSWYFHWGPHGRITRGCGSTTLRNWWCRSAIFCRSRSRRSPRS